eukprot:3885374-Rhodomonas_salina.2
MRCAEQDLRDRVIQADTEKLGASSTFKRRPSGASGESSEGGLGIRPRSSSVQSFEKPAPFERAELGGNDSMAMVGATHRKLRSPLAPVRRKSANDVEAQQARLTADNLILLMEATENEKRDLNAPDAALIGIPPLQNDEEEEEDAEHEDVEEKRSSS